MNGLRCGTTPSATSTDNPPDPTTRPTRPNQEPTKEKLSRPADPTRPHTENQDQRSGAQTATPIRGF